MKTLCIIAGLLLAFSSVEAETASCGELTADINKDGAVNLDDFFILVDQFGWTCKDATITVDLPGGATMEFVWTEPGTFTLGSPSSEPDRNDWEGPQHEVTISQGFYLGKYEITQAQWESVMETTPWVQEDPNSPAVWISWDDVQELIRRLNETAREEIYRLPTEAEWEFACRAGTETRWSFGDDESLLGNYAWYSSNNSPWGTKEVGQKLPNPWGLYDMHGNVWEWCQDWYEDYSSDAQVDPMGPASGSGRVVRGGYFDGDARWTRSAYRDYFAPDDRSYDFGARLLRIK